MENLIAELTSGDDERAEVAAQNLIETGPDAVQPLKALLNAPDTDHRWWATRTLAGIDHPETTALLMRAFHDDDPAVRQCAALGLRGQPNVQAIPDLIAALDSDDRLLARLCAGALIALDDRAVPALLQVMENGSPRARLEAARALAEIGDRRAVGVFFRAIRDGDSSLVEYWADIGLERMGFGMAFFTP